MDLIFNDDGFASVGLVDNQLISGLKGDIGDVPLELGQQVGSSYDNRGPTRDIVEDLIGGIVGHEVEEMLAIVKVAERRLNEVEVWSGAIIGSIF